MKNLKTIMLFAIALAIGAIIGITVYGKARKSNCCGRQEFETCRTIGALLSLADMFYDYWGRFPMLKDVQCELVAEWDEAKKSYLDGYGRAMRIEESVDKMTICSSGYDGIFDTSDDIVGVANKEETASSANVKGPKLFFCLNREWTCCEKKSFQCKSQGVKVALRVVEKGSTTRGFWVENMGEDACLKIPDAGIEYCIFYETDGGEKKTIQNGRSPYDTFKIVPLEGKARNSEGNTAYYFEVEMPRDCAVPISARIRVYMLGFDLLQTVSNVETLRKYMIGEPIELNIEL